MHRILRPAGLGMAQANYYSAKSFVYSVQSTEWKLVDNVRTLGLYTLVRRTSNYHLPTQHIPSTASEQPIGYCPSRHDDGGLCWTWEPEFSSRAGPLHSVRGRGDKVESGTYGALRTRTCTCNEGPVDKWAPHMEQRTRCWSIITERDPAATAKGEEAGKRERGSDCPKGWLMSHRPMNR